MINFNVYRSNKLPDLLKKLQRLNKSHALVGILDDPQTATYGAYVEFGWTQQVTRKQAYVFRKWWNINLKVGKTLYNPPRPFLRGTLWAYSSDWAHLTLNVLLRSNFDVERTYAFIGQYAGQCVQETIASGGIANAGQSFPIRSPFTMKVYNTRVHGFGIAGSDGNINTTKSMVLTGNMLGSITYKVIKG